MVNMVGSISSTASLTYGRLRVSGAARLWIFIVAWFMLLLLPCWSVSNTVQYSEAEDNIWHPVDLKENLLKEWTDDSRLFLPFHYADVKSVLRVLPLPAYLPPTDSCTPAHCPLPVGSPFSVHPVLSASLTASSLAFLTCIFLE